MSFPFCGKSRLFDDRAYPVTPTIKHTHGVVLNRSRVESLKSSPLRIALDHLVRQVESRFQVLRVVFVSPALVDKLLCQCRPSLPLRSTGLIAKVEGLGLRPHNCTLL